MSLDPPHRVTFIGIGAIGLPMARRIAAGGSTSPASTRSSRSAMPPRRPV